MSSSITSTTTSLGISFPYFRGPILREYDLESSVDHWLATATRTYQHASNARLENYGITYRQSHVIGWLAKEKELCQSELTERMMIDPATLVRFLEAFGSVGINFGSPRPALTHVQDRAYRT
jgi:hypothetical protein